ncbi:4-hydroxy-tetrahydrodipicolinate reductase [Kiloniella laminariae]|uniref:4-hydroxy-tetrahydrodipicolinate reductase n=1 Tax=Kiloniella laminariae TaxID=454162 RepID=UPI00037E1280|nr:4-hydroxy-tetrahydrodipicolinate reductase [Kiloniella laminariae]
MGSRIGIVGCAGRMGRMLTEVINRAEGCSVSGGTELPGSPNLGKDLGELAGIGALGVVVGDSAKKLFETSDVVIDFTVPAATLSHAKLAAETGCALVVGTTGMTAEQVSELEQSATRAPIVFARNMSLGVNLLMTLVQQVAAALDEDYDIEIVEMHHRHKVDAPSGTALVLGEAAAAGRGVALDKVADKVRDGIVGARKRGDIGFATLRGGDVVGDHSVIFAADGERIELGHRASNREVFARGAVKAARWLKDKPAGFYDMQDVLGLK